MDSLADHDRDVLVSTCIVDRLCGPLADALTGRHDGARWLAAELFVSLNTVKTHTRGIFRKLAVADRRHAVQRARELGLL